MQISFMVLTPLFDPKTPQGRGDTGGYTGGDPHRRGYIGGFLGKVQMGPPLVYVVLWG